MSGQVILLKMGMGRTPAVDVVVSSALLPTVCKHFFSMNDAISYITPSGVKPEGTDPRNAIYIADLEDTSSFLSLLLVRGDPHRAIPGFVNPKTRVIIRSKPEEPGFAPGASCHVVISKQEIAAGPDQGRCRMVMEKSRGIGRSLARDFLATLLNRYAEEFPDLFVAEKKRRSKKEKPASISYHPTLRLHPQENGSLRKDLEEGRIGGFKLTRGSTKFHGEVDEPSVQKLDVQLQARIAPTNDFSKVKRLVDHVQNTLGLISFESLNLELVDDGGKIIENTRSIDIEGLDEADMRYCKVLSMPDFGSDTDEVRGSIDKPTKEFIIRCISNEPNWK
jgi:hypothetical protein